jgi:hypothetical protein
LRRGGLALLLAPVLLASILLAFGRRARAAEAIDDPKLERRLGTRQDAPVPAAPVDAPGAATSAPVETLAERPPPSNSSGEQSLPRVKLGYRRFDFVRVGASDSSGTAASEPFDCASIDFYPLSTVVRFGLTTQYGWQSGNMRNNGDYFIAQSFSIGGQIPRPEIVPFAEAYGGGGYMRRVQFGRTVPTAYWQIGADVGAEWFFAQHGFLSVALGYLHPVNGFVTAKTMGSVTTGSKFTSVFVDTWSFKLGIGL